MHSIKKEIDNISDETNNLLKNAPHTQLMLVDNWDYPYSRSQACFPNNSLKDNKYWPSVRRINEVQGDRHLMCSCASLDAYEEKKEIITS